MPQARQRKSCPKCNGVLDDSPGPASQVQTIIDSQGCSPAVTLAASMHLFAGSYNLAALNLAGGVIDFIDQPQGYSRIALLSSCVALLGIALGLLLNGLFANLYTRKSVSSVFLGFLMLGNCIMAKWSMRGPAFFMAYVAQFCMGLGIGSTLLNATLISSELTPTESRVRVQTKVFSAQALGQLAALGSGTICLRRYLDNGTASEVALQSARAVTLGIGLISTICAMASRLRLPESPRYLLEVHNSPDLAIAAAHQLAAPFHSPSQRSEDPCLSATSTQEVTGCKRRNKWNRIVGLGLYRCLLGKHKYIFSLFLITALWAAVNLSYFIAALDNPQNLLGVWAPLGDTLVSEPNFYLRAQSASDVLARWVVGLLMGPAPAVLGSLLSRLLLRIPVNRRLLLGMLGSGANICLARLALRFPPPQPVAPYNMHYRVLYAVMQLLFHAGLFPLMFTIPADVFPTRHRAVLLGLSGSMAILGSVAFRALVPLDCWNRFNLSIFESQCGMGLSFIIIAHEVAEMLYSLDELKLRPGKLRWFPKSVPNLSVWRISRL